MRIAVSFAAVRTAAFTVCKAAISSATILAAGRTVGIAPIVAPSRAIIRAGSITATGTAAGTAVTAAFASSLAARLAAIGAVICTACRAGRVAGICAVS
ncbi:MAG: hypothetical protein ACLTWW_12205 [Negativibacillus sp.]